MTRRFSLLLGLGLLALGVVLVLATLSGDEEPAGPQLRTVFVGDSITSGVEPATTIPSEEHSWVTAVVTDPRSPWRLEANVATIGRTLEQMELGFQDEVLARDPEAVVIMGGTNDLLLGMPLEGSLEALRSMVLAAQDAGIEVWVVGPPPLDADFSRPIAPMVETQARMAAELDVPFVALGEGLVGEDGRWLPGLSYDGVHPTPEGARRIADAILDELDQ